MIGFTSENDFLRISDENTKRRDLFLSVANAQNTEGGKTTNDVSQK
jgi:hypothetical protein